MPPKHMHSHTSCNTHIYYKHNLHSKKPLDDEEYRHDIDIEFTPQENLDIYMTSIPSQQPKWAQKLSKAAREVVGNPDDRRRMRSQYHNEYVALSHIDPLLPER